jgi:adenosylcobinamide kinase / adenosylcobinamide-phosphate guanylyltransferase
MEGSNRGTSSHCPVSSRAGREGVPGGKARRPRGVVAQGVNPCSFEGEEPIIASSSSQGRAFFASRLILVTGGARSGKSRFAQRLAEQAPFSRRLFIATGVPCDPEMAARIVRHRRDRGSRWKTLEEPLNLPEKLPDHFLTAGSFCLLDCLPTFVTNHLLAGKKPSQILSLVRRLIRAFRQSGNTALVVTNEVGLGLVPDHSLGRVFRDLLGEVNQEAAKQADEVHLMISGIPWRVK